MKPFMDENFLLSSETARELYQGHAAKMPIFDYHCHVSPREIAEDRRFESIAQLWLGGDHYKWRLIRARGCPEENITGAGFGKETFLRFAEVLPRAAGNPVYHWTHLELRRYFGCDKTLSPETAAEIWELCNERLAQPDMSVRQIILKSNVKALCTTDDPADSLEWHRALRGDGGFPVRVLPTFRPDRAVNIDAPGFRDYIEALGQAAGREIRTTDELKETLADRMDMFAELGCVLSDHGPHGIVFREGDPEAAYKRAMSGAPVSRDEADAYKTDLMLFLGREYARRGWAMQLHYGAMRNVNPRGYASLGPDTGFDCIGTPDCSLALAAYMGALDGEGLLPRTVLYSLNPNDNAMLATLAGCFPGGGIAGKVQHGSAWWFNDTKPGMEAQLTNLASVGVLGNFIGMLTDSRSFLSYTRHEYFRRILCNLLGGWAENGEYPRDMKTLGEMAEDISFNNAWQYFGMQ